MTERLTPEKVCELRNREADQGNPLLAYVLSTILTLENRKPASTSDALRLGHLRATLELPSIYTIYRQTDQTALGDPPRLVGDGSDNHFQSDIVQAERAA